MLPVTPGSRGPLIGPGDSSGQLGLLKSGTVRSIIFVAGPVIVRAFIGPVHLAPLSATGGLPYLSQRRIVRSAINKTNLERVWWTVGLPRDWRPASSPIWAPVPFRFLGVSRFCRTSWPVPAPVRVRNSCASLLHLNRSTDFRHALGAKVRAVFTREFARSSLANLQSIKRAICSRNSRLFIGFSRVRKSAVMIESGGGAVFPVATTYPASRRPVSALGVYCQCMRQAAIRTPLTEVFELEYPIVLAPMGGASGAELAAAVSNAGGLGLIGGAYGDASFLSRELDAIHAKTTRKWGVGLITWKAGEEALEAALSHKPDAFFISFGDPLKFSRQIQAAGCVLICQVQDVESARRAKEAGANFIVAQGTEAGGHGTNTRSTLPLVPAVIDAVTPTPVLTAGGIADGRGVAAALALGAAGAVIGTRFCATRESLLHGAAKDRLMRAQSGDTVRTSVFDTVRGYEWPASFTGRALRNRFQEEWEGKNGGLRDNEPAREGYRTAQRNGDFDTAVIWAGEAVDLVSGLPAAGELLSTIGRHAQQEIRRLAGLLG